MLKGIFLLICGLSFGATPEYLYKVLTVDDWSKSQKYVALSDMDREFIHLATEEQLPAIIAKFWKGVPEYIILKLQVSKLQGNLVYEANPGGTNKYYHLYNGKIPLDAIVEINPPSLFFDK